MKAEFSLHKDKITTSKSRAHSRKTGTVEELDPSGPPKPLQLACLAIASGNKTVGLEQILGGF